MPEDRQLSRRISHQFPQGTHLSPGKDCRLRSSAAASSCDWSS